MGQSAAYCSECYNKFARVQDAGVKAAESEGKAPMTKQGACSQCGATTTVVSADGRRRAPIRSR